MSLSYNRKRKRNRKALFAAFPELRQVYWLIRSGKVPRWHFDKNEKGEIRMSRAGVGRRYVHRWTIHNTFGKELRNAIFKSAQRA